jgi:hypothetical protein
MKRVAKEVAQMISPDIGVLIWFGVILALVFAVLGWSVLAVWRTSQKAERLGYRGIREYMRAAPRTDAEKKDAVNMTMRGAALCLLGIVFAPFVLLGVVPLYYGGRKITLSLLGLDLPADANDVA